MSALCSAGWWGGGLCTVRVERSLSSTFHVLDAAFKLLKPGNVGLLCLEVGARNPAYGAHPLSGLPFSPVLPLKTSHLKKKVPVWVFGSV